MQEITEISPLTLWKWLHGDDTAPEFFLLDVRNPDDAARWRIEGARDVPRVEVPYFDFVDDDAAAVAKVPTDKGLPVVVCAKGGSSEFVANVLREHGRRAANLAGGMTGWGDLQVPVQVPLASEDAGKLEIHQISRYGKGCLSYVVIANGEAAVVDPARFTGFYEEFAAAHGAKIVEILETHVHADHLSGGPQLAKATGASYRVLNAFGGREPEIGVPVKPVENVEIRLGGANGVSIATTPIRTPGHTPGSTSYLVANRYLLSGDTLFVKGIGRPDLGGHVEEWGRALYSTLHGVVANLPDDIEVLPAHFASAMEANDRGLVRGRLGELRRNAPEFAIPDPDSFVAAMKAGVKEPPAIYGEIIKANLGLAWPTADQAAEWELGRNECAATAAKRRAAEAAERAARAAQQQ